MSWVLGIGFIVLIVLAVGYYFSSQVLNIKVIPYDETLQSEITSGRVAEDLLDNLEKEEIYLDSPHGYKLHGYFIPLENSQKTVVIVHGVTVSLYHSLKYMELFRKRGYNVLIYNHRRHGLSGGTTTTYGFYEKDDLGVWVELVRKRFGQSAEIGLLGESMGAATTLQYAPMDPNIAFIIADCPYSNFKEQVTFRLKEEYKLPPFPLVPLSNLMIWLRSGMNFTLGKAAPIKEIGSVNTPIMFVHGLNDLYIPHEMSVAMYHAKPGLKRLFLAPNSDHAESYANNQEAYDTEVEAFLEEVRLARLSTHIQTTSLAQ
jgi:fermentation-respiration switch protein FrsA (DUF1100 family)